MATGAAPTAISACQRETEPALRHCDASLSEGTIELAGIALQKGQGLRPLGNQMHARPSIGLLVEVNLHPAELFRLQGHRDPPTMLGRMRQGDDNRRHLLHRVANGG